MKNKIILLLCAAVVMMLCACQPLNVSSGDSDVVTVAFRVSGENVSAKAISIGNPVADSNVIYQYKAIPDFTPDKGKELVGATGDVWTDFPSVYNGSEFKLRFTKGSWTFYVRGIDKNDLTPLYKIASPLKAYLSSKSTQDIIFNMEEDPEAFSTDIGSGYGTISLNVVAQGYSEKGELIVTFSPIASDSETEFIFKPAAIADSKSYFIENFKLASGFYVVNFVYHDGIYKTPMGPYDVKVITNKTTNVTGRIAHQSEFVTYFSSNDNKYDFIATFNETAVELINNNNNNNNLIDKQSIAFKEKVANLQKEAVEKFKITDDVKAEAVKKELAQAVEKVKELKVKGQINFSLTTIDVEDNAQQNEPEPAQQKEAKKAVNEIDISMQKKIGIIHEVICNGRPVNLDSNSYKLSQDGNTAYYTLFKGLFTKLADEQNTKYSPENVITIRVTWTNNNKVIRIAESEPITVLFIE